jgi:hypothetical protein
MSLARSSSSVGFSFGESQIHEPLLHFAFGAFDGDKLQVPPD